LKIAVRRRVTKIRSFLKSNSLANIACSLATPLSSSTPGSSGLRQNQIITDHPGIDWYALVDASQIVIDTRNTTWKVIANHDCIFKVQTKWLLSG
jgi:hypothetical protein